ncbi:MAG: SCO1664 family protein [Actinomycetota bacterium]
MQLSRADVLTLLREGDIELLGLMPDSSNYTFGVIVTAGETKTLAVYKPEEGEMPLWDFPDGTLWRREIAAYVLSEALGWGFVPPTVAREGPHGIGSLQLYVEHDPEEHYFSLMPAFADTFRRIAAFDVVCNNADRKGGHCLLEREPGRIWVVDHGVCFHEEPKLRTVIWDFAGERLPEDVLKDLHDLDARALEEWLEPAEVDAVVARAARLADEGIFPAPPEARRAYPWPPV